MKHLQKLDKYTYNGGNMLLSAIKDKVEFRPGDLSGGFDRCYVPKESEKVFWKNLYEYLKSYLWSPIHSGGTAIDPFFGYFGYRFHPVNLRANYFHIGIDVMAEVETKVYPIANGIFEYSGFSDLNGNYVLLSHPTIKTKDGYIFYSTYIHLQKFYFRFNLLQKVLRELSGRRLPKIEIERDAVLGEVGATGNIRGLVPHLHLQLEFRDSRGSIVAIDPAQALGIQVRKNLTKQIQSLEEFKLFYEKNKIQMSHWSKLWDL